MVTLAEEVNAAADRLDALNREPQVQFVGKRGGQEAVTAQAEWLRCAGRLLARKPQPWLDVLAQQGTSFDAPLGYAVRLARAINQEAGSNG